jgi:hypothetical protein
MSIETQIDQIHEIVDERPTTEAERAACNELNTTMRGCSSISPTSHFCVLRSDHDGLHISTRGSFSTHLASWGTAAQWGISPAVAETLTPTEMPTEDATTAFIYGKLHEPVAVNISDFSGYTATESREQYNYARRQLLELADKYRQSEDDNAIARQVAEANLSTSDANTAHYRMLANEHQQDFKTFADALLEEAENRGWCADYERFAERVNDSLLHNEVPHRTKQYTVTNTYTVTVSYTVEMRDEDEAIEYVQNNISAPSFRCNTWDVIDTSDDSEWSAEATD